MSLHYFHISHPDLMSKDIILPTIDKPLLKFFECSMVFPIFSPSTSISPNSSLKSTYTSRKFFNRCTLHSIFQNLERFQEKHIHRHELHDLFSRHWIFLLRFEHFQYRRGYLILSLFSIIKYNHRLFFCLYDSSTVIIFILIL